MSGQGRRSPDGLRDSSERTPTLVDCPDVRRASSAPLSGSLVAGMAGTALAHDDLASSADFSDQADAQAVRRLAAAAEPHRLDDLAPVGAAFADRSPIPASRTRRVRRPAGPAPRSRSSRLRSRSRRGGDAGLDADRRPGPEGSTVAAGDRGVRVHAESAPRTGAR